MNSMNTNSTYRTPIEEDESIDLFSSESDTLDVGSVKRPLKIILPIISFVLILAIIFILIVLFYKQSEKIILHQESNDLVNTENFINLSFHHFYANIRRDMLLLSQSSDVKTMANYPSKIETFLNSKAVFKNQLINTPYYANISFFSIKTSEVMGVFRDHNISVDYFSTQKKSSIDFKNDIVEAVRYAPGNVHFSDVSLKNYWISGKPYYKKILRSYIPLKSQFTNAVTLVMVIEVNFDMFIQELIHSEVEGIKLFLMNYKGNYIFHPDEKYFLDDEVSLNAIGSDFPELISIVENNEDRYHVAPSRINKIIHPGFYSILNLSHHGATKPLRLLLIYDNDKYVGELKNLRHQLFLIGIVLAVLALFVVFYITRKMLKPLVDMSDAISAYEAGDAVNLLPVKAVDEVGVLSRSFYNLFKHKREKELELEKIRHYMDGITNKAPVLLAYVDKNLTYKFANQCYERWSGIPLNNFIGLCVEDVVGEDGFAELEPYITHVMGGNPVSFETEIAYGDSDKRYVNITYTPEIDKENNVEGFYVCCEDLTLNKKSTAEIEELSTRLDFALETPGIGVWDYDIVTGELFWDERMCDIYHIKVNDFSGDYNAWTSRVHPDDLATSDALINESVSTGEDFVTEFRIIWPNGQERWIAAHGRIVKDDDEKHVRMIGTNVDITTRKQLALEREQALIKAEESAQLKSEFLASMSHEIRTPMNGVLGMLGLIKRTQLNQQQAHYVGLAKSSAESLLTLINDILDFSKVEAGKMELEIIPFNLSAMLGDFAEAIAQRAQEKGLELVLDLTNVHTTMVQGDPGRLRQVLSNLVGNAIKFTEEGEVIIRIELANSKNQQLRLICSVNDTGIGIPPEKIETLFDSFSQVDASTTRKYGGTGLGLAIAKQLCELMGGDLEVSSELGHGSQFTFDIYLEESKEAKDLLPTTVVQDKRILVVDQNKANNTVLVEQLRRWGAEANGVYSGHEALEVLGNQSYAAAFINMKMPDMDAKEVARMIRNDSRFNDMKLAVMTSLGQKGDAKRFVNAGFSSWFPKPATINDLFRTLDTLLGDQSGSSSLVSDQVSSLTSSKKLQGRPANSTSTIDKTIAESSSIRLLLVEDNVINQEVALGILEGLGLDADIAGNGIEAIAALNNAPADAPYDLILMDCQMPEMDGYEATRSIRAGKAPNPQIPIIAMTANAMKGDKEKCLAAGMSDYLSKPIDPEKLWSLLDEWLRLTAAAPDDNDEQTEEEIDAMSDDENVWDESGFMNRIMNNEKIAARLIDLFKTDTPKTIEELEKAINEEKAEEAGLLAHKLKGSVSNLGGIELADLAQKIEQAGKSDDLDEVKVLWPNVIPQYDKLLSTIEQRG